MKIIAGVVLAAVAVAAGWYVWANYASPFRYRLTATIESGGKVYTGSGVIQVRIDIQTFSLSGHASLPRVTGDAVVVDVPGVGPIFFLLTAGYSVDWDANIAFTMFRHLLPDPPNAKRTADNISAMARLQASAEIPRERYPLIVAFRDLAQPDSVYEVFPDDLSPPLDVGARVVSLTIEMTRDPPTTGIMEQKLPWVGGLRTNLAGQQDASSAALADNLSRRDFIKRGV